MTVAAKLSRKLYETFGDEAAESMIDWMQNVDTERARLRDANELLVARVDARMTELFAQFREELRAEWRSEMTAFRDEIRTELRAEIAKLSDRIDARYADLIKWSFAFWIGSTVTLMLGMAAILRITK